MFFVSIHQRSFVFLWFHFFVELYGSIFFCSASIFFCSALRLCNDFFLLWFDQIIDNKHFVSSQPFLILLSLHACLPVRAVSERTVCEQNCKKKRILEKRIEISWNASYHYYYQTITLKINTCLLCLILNLFTWKSIRQVSLPENKQKRETIWSFWLFD